MAGWRTRPPPPSALARPLRGAESHVEPPGRHHPNNAFTYIMHAMDAATRSLLPMNSFLQPLRDVHLGYRICASIVGSRSLTTERPTAMVLSDLVRARVRVLAVASSNASMHTHTDLLCVCFVGKLCRGPDLWHCRHAKPASTPRRRTHVVTPRSPSARADVCLLQPTNYWKNAQQNGMPFTLNPAILYRGARRTSKRNHPQAAPRLAHAIYAACHRQASPPTS